MEMGFATGAYERTVTAMDEPKQCQCCTNYIHSDVFDEDPWCRIKPYHQLPKTKPEEPRCEYFTSPVFMCKWKDGDTDGV